MMMIRAGAPVDEMIQELLPHLEPGDVIIDGGNSDFRDTERRVKEVEARGMLYVGTGISGGEIGALTGPSVMPGGSPAAWPLVKDLLQGIAAKLDDGTPCCEWIGSGGAGNYERIRKGYRLTLGIAGSIGLGAGILFFVLNHEIFGLFVNEPEAIEAGGNYLKILALSQLFMVTESVTAGAFNGTGHTTPPALTGIIFTGARIPMAYFLTSFPQLGLTGIWWSITISSILKGSVLPLWFLHFQRKLK